MTDERNTGDPEDATPETAPPATPEAALAALEAAGDPEQAVTLLAYHKAERRYLGVPAPILDAMVRDWRGALPLAERLELAAALWQGNVHEGRIAAAKLLTQARIRPDDSAVWAMLTGWIPDLDAWALADHLSKALERRIAAEPSRLDEVEGWIADENLWTRRAALEATRPFARLPNPKSDDLAARERILGWAEALSADRDWFIQKAVAAWLQDLSKHDPERARMFIDTQGTALKGFARKEAARRL